MSFERNFHKTSAVCPKCGSSEPKPKYVPPNHIRADIALNCYFLSRDCARYFNTPAPKEPDYHSFVIPDKVVNLCACGYEWEEKEPEQVKNEEM